MTAFHRMVLLFLLAAIAAVRAGAQEKEPVKIEHADSLVGREVNGERVRELIGNVRISQGRTVVTCRHALQYLQQNRVILEGNVEVQDDSARLVGDHGIYDGNSRIAEAFDRVFLEDKATNLHARYGKYFVNERKAYFSDHVEVIDTSTILTSDALEYHRTAQRTLASGNVTIRGINDNITIGGQEFENDRKTAHSRMTGHPWVMRIDTASGGKKDTLIILARILESYQDTLERLIATDSVEMIRGTSMARAGLGVYYTKLDSILLVREPTVWYGTGSTADNQVSGDSIMLKLRKRKLETVYVERHAVAISQADSAYPARYNQMNGQEIVLHFNSDKITAIDVNTTATSLYYLFDGGKGNGANRITGDRIRIRFEDGKMKRITTQSGVEGEYYPEKMIRGREEDYNLPGFHWMEFHPRYRPGMVF